MSPINVLLERGEKLTIVIVVDHSPFWEIATHVLAKLIEQGEECGFEPKEIRDIFDVLLEDKPGLIQ